MADEKKKPSHPYMKNFQNSPDCLFLFRCHLRDEMCVNNSSHYFYLFADIWTQIHNAMKIQQNLQMLCNVRSYQDHKTSTLQVISTNDHVNFLAFFYQDAFQCLLANCFWCSIVGSLVSFLTFQQKKSAGLIELKSYRQAGAVYLIQQLNDYRSLRGSDLRRT